MPHHPIAVTFALPQESGDFRQALRPGRLKGVRVEHFGVGPFMAELRIRHLLDVVKPRLLICAGFAGGLDPSLGLGDLVVAENLTAAKVLARLRGAAQGQPQWRFGSIISRDLPVESVADKAALFQETGALAVDMESKAVAAACRVAGVPLLVVRTISDPAGAPLPVPFADWFDVRGQRPRVFGLLKYLALHPGRIAPFTHFVRGLAPARRSLANFLIGFLEQESSFPL